MFDSKLKKKIFKEIIFVHKKSIYIETIIYYSSFLLLFLYLIK